MNISPSLAWIYLYLSRSYCILDSLQEEYLHQTYNSMPDMTQKLNLIIVDPDIQWNIYNDSRAEVTRNKPTNPNITKAVKQFEAMFMYTSALRKILNEMADNIKILVQEETEAINKRSKWPIVMLVCLTISVPVIVYLSSKASYSMRSHSTSFILIYLINIVLQAIFSYLRRASRRSQL